MIDLSFIVKVVRKLQDVSLSAEGIQILWTHIL